MKSKIRIISVVSLIVFLALTAQVSLAGTFTEELMSKMGSGQEESAIELILADPNKARQVFEDMETVALSGTGDPWLPALVLNFIARTFEARLEDGSLTERLLLAGMLMPESSWKDGPLAEIQSINTTRTDVGKELKLSLDIALRSGSLQDAVSVLDELGSWVQSSSDPRDANLMIEALIGEIALRQASGQLVGLQERGDAVLQLIRQVGGVNMDARLLETTLLLAGGALKARRPASLGRRLEQAKALVDSQDGTAARRARFVITTYEHALAFHREFSVQPEVVLAAHNEAWDELGELGLDYDRNWLSMLDAVRFWGDLLIKVGKFKILQEDMARLNKVTQATAAEEDMRRLLAGPALPIIFCEIDLAIELAGALRNAKAFQQADEACALSERELTRLKSALASVDVQSMPALNSTVGGVVRLLGRISEERGRTKLAQSAANLKVALTYFNEALESYENAGDVIAKTELAMVVARILRRIGAEQEALALSKIVLTQSRSIGYWPSTVHALLLRADLLQNESEQSEAKAIVEQYIQELKPDSNAVESIRDQYLGILQPVLKTD